ncbi:MAG: hypothetical protein A2W19_13070 [Spirochaetes bacterium RBG_16_49_21]|nr:MAG: hypothetical protein A2W19_13070 [Spirochaetes bacterium RBG_16_49_21]
MSNFKDNNLEIILEEGAKNILSWYGKSEARDPSSLLIPYFKEILNKIKGKELIIKFEQLKYMNSSTVPPIIQLIKDLEDSGIDSTITYDKNSKWQLASFKALDTIVRAMKHITVVGV